MTPHRLHAAAAALAGMCASIAATGTAPAGPAPTLDQPDYFLVNKTRIDNPPQLTCYPISPGDTVENHLHGALLSLWSSPGCDNSGRQIEYIAPGHSGFDREARGVLVIYSKG